MKLNELIENYGNYEVKEGFLNFLQKPKPKTVWDLQYGDEYWFISPEGDIGCDIWEDYEVDNDRRNVGDCYLTEEYGNFVRERKKIIAEMKRLGGTEDIMSLGDVDDLKCCIAYNHEISKLYLAHERCTHHLSNIYFTTKEQAQKAIDEIGEDRIKKYLFYVED